MVVAENPFAAKQRIAASRMASRLVVGAVAVMGLN
jgi:hypothetical protein